MEKNILPYTFPLTLTTLRYSASTLERDNVACLLDDYDSKLSQRTI